MADRKRKRMKLEDGGGDKPNKRPSIPTSNFHNGAAATNTWIPGKSWAWILAPDGSFSMVDNTAAAKTASSTASAVPMEQRHPRIEQDDSSTHASLIPKQDHEAKSEAVSVEDAAEINSTSDLLAAPDECPSAAIDHANDENNETACHKQERNSVLRKGWAWLLKSDGSFATVDHSRRVTSRSGKRKRRIQSDSAPAPAFPRPADSECKDKSKDDSKDCNRPDTSENQERSYGDVPNHGNKDKAPSVGHDQRWESKFQLLVEYKTKHKRTKIPRSNRTLGNWAAHQRSAFKLGKLSKYRRQRLTSIGFAWEEDVWMEDASEEDAWGQMYQRLLKYKDKHGTTFVPRGYKEDPPLELWVRSQRLRCTEQNHIDRLNAIGFVWDVKTYQKDVANAAWDEMYLRLSKFKEKCGTARVTPTLIRGKYRKGYNELKKWVRTQRYTCNDQGRIDRLNKIGFVWDVRKDNKKKSKAHWDLMYRRLLKYKEKHGTTDAPPSTKLATWVRTQRHYCKDQDQIDLLNKIGFVWDAQKLETARLKASWDWMYQRLLKYKEKHGTSHVPHNHNEDPKLGRWVSRQRYQCKDQDRIDLLNKIGFLWNTYGAFDERAPVSVSTP